jgi:hypothetical protein
VAHVDGKHASGCVGAKMACDNGQAIDARFGMEREQALTRRRRETGRGAFALGHFNLGDRLIGTLSD